MAEQEQCVRVTRAMKRRAAVAGAEDQSAPKKRVVLGELPNLSNVVVPVNQNAGVEPLKPKCVSKAKAKKKGLTTTAVKTTKEIDTGLGGDGKSDDPQLCRAYASDIYEYLRKTEVRGFLVFIFFQFLY
jgi:cyclin A